jgi:hypothetical protein
MALHTWGRTLSQHPHVHCVLSAGGIDSSGRWKQGNAAFVLPLKPLQLLFRGKFLARLKALVLDGHLRLPPDQPQPYWQSCMRQLYRAHWNIQIEPPYDHARGLALYLARYVKGGPLPKDRALSIDSKGFVRFGYTDHRDGRRKTLCLHVHEFIARILWHAPPTGSHTVRYAGLYTSAQREQYQLARTALTPQPMPALAQTLASHQLYDANTSPIAIQPQTCPRCNAPLIYQPLPRQMHQSGEISRAQTNVNPASTVHLGPTHRSNGHSTAGRHRWRPHPPLVEAGYRMPLN